MNFDAYLEFFVLVYTASILGKSLFHLTNNMTNNKEIIVVMATPPKLFLFKRLIFDRMHAYMTVK